MPLLWRWHNTKEGKEIIEFSCLIGLISWLLSPNEGIFPKVPRLKCPCKIHGNNHAKKSIHLKILEWTYMVHGHSRDLRISIRVFKWMDNSAWILHGHFNPGFQGFVGAETGEQRRGEAQLAPLRGLAFLSLSIDRSALCRYRPIRPTNIDWGNSALENAFSGGIR